MFTSRAILRFLAPRTTVRAHCDLPCGVYDPEQARIEAESCYKIIEKYTANDDPAFRTRAVAIKEVLAWQLGEAMKAGKLSRNRLAQRMGTSRSQVSRLLDPKDGNVTLTRLQRAARIVGRSLRLELICAHALRLLWWAAPTPSAV